MKLEKQFTSAEAIAFAESKVWHNWTDEQIVRLQLFQDKMCVPFSRFHEAIEKVLGRPVPPSLQEILDLIPAEKRIIIGI